MQIQIDSSFLGKQVPITKSKKLGLLAQAIRILFIAPLFFLFDISHAFAVTPQEITQLLNQGLGIDAKLKALEAVDDSKDSKEKKANTQLLLSVCMIVTDNDCFNKYWDANYKEFYESLDLMPKNTIEEKERWSMTVDYLTAMYIYRWRFNQNEDSLKKQLSYVKDGVVGANRYEYSSLKTVLEANAAATIGDRVLARKLLRRAKALVLSRNLNNITEQLTLAYCLETSLYQLFDSQDIRRFVKSFNQASTEAGINIDSYVNPYIALRVHRVLLESGILNSSDRAATVNYLNLLYQNLQLPPKSEILNIKESFYAHLALDKSWGNDLNLNFDPNLEFEKIIDPDSFAAIGVKAYLESTSLSSSKKSSLKIDEAMKWFESLNDIEDAVIKRNIRHTYFLLASLKYRLEGDLEKERQYLEDWVDSQLDYFKRGGFNLLDQPPALTGLSEKIIRYTIQRLIEIKPKSQALLRLTYFSIVTLNAKKDGDVTMSYALLQASESDLKDRQIQDRIRLNADYSRTIADAYYKSAKHLIDARSKITYDGGVNILETNQLLEKLKSSDQQLSDFKNKLSPFVNLDYRTLIPKNSDSTVVLFAEADGYLLSLSLKKDSTKVHLLALSKDDQLTESLRTLTSTRLDAIPAEKIKMASIHFSRKIFGISASLSSNIQILSGPTVLSVPYTLLSDPTTGKWLIEHANVESYLSPQHREIGEKKSHDIRQTDYIAFANPMLRTKNELATVDSVAGIIRGTNMGLNSLTELPETEVEAINFSNAFKGKKELYFGKDANINNLVSLNLDNVSVLSFSTHGVLAGEVDGAKSSSIVLSPTGTNNGLIPTDWLFSLTGSPHLAILSTCNSGTSAQPLDSSELTSLASVFLLKGSGAVISSYWQVDSQGTAEMMSLFSQEINKSSNYSIAFLKTVRNLKANSKWNHPSVWAAFVMIGNHNQYKNTKVANDEIKIDINGFIRDWYIKNDKIVLLGSENGPDDEWRITETVIDLNLKNPINSLRKDRTYPPFIDVQVSKANTFGTIAAIRDKDTWTFSDVTRSGDFIKICTLENIATDWLIGDFFRTRTHIFNLFKRTVEDGVEYGLVSISIKGCVAIVKAPFHFKTGIKGFANLRFFPISTGKEVVFATSNPAIGNDATYFDGPITELGIASNCKIDNVNYYHVIDSDLSLKRSITYDNVLIDNINFAGTSLGVIGLERDPCTKKETVRFLLDDFFTSENISDRNKSLINSDQESVQVSELISKNFDNVSHLWWEPGAEYLFIVGIPIFPAKSSSNISKEMVGEDAFYDWLFGLESVYSYKIATKKWSKIATRDQCHFPQPIGYGKESYFLCNDRFNKLKKNNFLKRIL